MADMVSPLDGIVEAGRFGRVELLGVVLSYRTCGSLAQVGCWPDSHGKVKKAIRQITGLGWTDGHGSPANDGHTLLPIGPGRVLIDADDADIVDRLRGKISPDDGAVIDLSHARVTVRISGNKAEWVLSKGITVDFSLAGFPAGTALATSHHDTGLTIRRADDQTFDLYIFTSLARDFWSWLARASAEVGYEVQF